MAAVPSTLRKWSYKDKYTLASLLGKQEGQCRHNRGSDPDPYYLFVLSMVTTYCFFCGRANFLIVLFLMSIDLNVYDINLE